VVSELTATGSDPASPPDTVEELRARAARLVPVLRERSAACEELREIPQATRDDFAAEGFLRIAQPVRFGGWGFGVDAVAELAVEIARGCPSTAWMASQWPGHNFMVGMLPLEAQQEYWADSFDVFSSTASAVVRMDCEPVPGGVHVTAQMKFSSGVDAAAWLLLLTPLGMCLVPKSDFRIVDDWRVMGLRGTGSKSVVIEDAFVPAHRLTSLEDLLRGRSPGADLYPDNPFYRLPMNVVLNSLLLASTVGTARGLVELFDERVRTRIDGHTGKHAFERPGTQLRFAEATAEVDTALLIMRDTYAELRTWGSSGSELPLHERSRIRRNIAYSAKLALQAADRLLESGDASGMYDSQLIQRWGRDVHMAGLQYVLTWDEPALDYSRIRWGLEPEARST
jgi:alkylation response protein AidB-like acyl-CoA dehydrogenase